MRNIRRLRIIWMNVNLTGYFWQERSFGKVIPSFEHFKDVVALKESLERYKPKGYYILIKGSNSMKLSQLQEIL